MRRRDPCPGRARSRPFSLIHWCVWQKRWTGALGISEEYSDIVENTGRFNYVNSLRVFLHPDSRVIRTSRVTYPYWENAARVAESRSGFYAVLIILLLLFPAGVVIYWFYRGISSLRGRGKTLLKKLVR